MRQNSSGLRRALERMGKLWVSKSTQARRTLFRSETREREASELERLDRLRNPRNYQGK